MESVIANRLVIQALPVRRPDGIGVATSVRMIRLPSAVTSYCVLKDMSVLFVKSAAGLVDWLARGGHAGPGIGQYGPGSAAAIGGTLAIPRGTGVARSH
jgi:hypothetical protein